MLSKFDSYRGCPDFITLEHERKLEGFGCFYENDNDMDFNYHLRSIPSYPGFAIGLLVFLVLVIFTVFHAIVFISTIIEINFLPDFTGQKVPNIAVWTLVGTGVFLIVDGVIFQQLFDGSYTLMEIEKRKNTISDRTTIYLTVKTNHMGLL